MAKRILKIGFTLTILFLSCCPRVFSYFEEEEAVEVYQNDQFLLMEEDSVQNQFFALVKKENYHQFVQFNGYFNQVFSIMNLFDLEDLSRSVSTIDRANRRYMFTTTTGRQSQLYVLGLDTGEILSQSRFDYRIVAMEYDEMTGYIYGLAQNKNGNAKTIRIDPTMGDLTSLSDLNRSYSMDYNSAFYNAGKQEVWIKAANRKNEYLLTISTETGKASAIRVIHVAPDSSLVYNFNTMKLNQTLFSAGTADSIFLLGFNEQFKTAFILHLGEKSVNAKEKVDGIHRQLLEFSAGGIKDYQLMIVCPKSFDNFVAYTKALALETKLKETNAFEEIKRKEFFIGNPYNIVVNVDGMFVY